MGKEVTEIHERNKEVGLTHISGEGDEQRGLSLNGGPPDRAF